MGFVVYLVGHFQCVRCRSEAERAIQTKLLRTELDNREREYRVGDSEVIDGLSDYFPLVQRTESRLVIAVGDWDCAQCGLAWQWAKAVFDVDECRGRMVGTLRELSTLQPHSPESLSEAHYLDEWLAMLSGLWGGQESSTAGLARWQRLSVAEQSRLVAEGYRAWARDVAGVILPEPHAAPA